MKQFYSARNGLEAHSLRLFLESQGIEAQVFGDNNALEIGIAFTPASAPRVFVHEEDFDRAMGLLDEFHNLGEVPSARGSWICPNCSEVVEEQFDTCWNCETLRVGVSGRVARTHEEELDEFGEETSTREVAAAPSPASYSDGELSRRKGWVQVTAVALVSSLIVVGTAAARFSLFRESSWGVYSICVWDLIIYTAVLALVVYFVQHSGQSWSDFGMKRPAIVFDLVMGLALYILLFVLVFFALDIAMNIWRPSEVREFMEVSPRLLRPLRETEFTLVNSLLLYATVVEEITMRGFLLTRLRQMSIPWPGAILIGSLLSLVFHISYGWGALLISLLICLLFSLVFWFGRRLWPILLTHLAIVVINILRSG